jgi:hypothetical protein
MRNKQTCGIAGIQKTSDCESIRPTHDKFAVSKSFDGDKTVGEFGQAMCRAFDGRYVKTEIVVKVIL